MPRDQIARPRAAWANCVESAMRQRAMVCATARRAHSSSVSLLPPPASAGFAPAGSCDLAGASFLCGAVFMGGTIAANPTTRFHEVWNAVECVGHGRHATLDRARLAWEGKANAAHSWAEG